MRKEGVGEVLVAGFVNVDLRRENDGFARDLQREAAILDGETTAKEMITRVNRTAL